MSPAIRNALCAASLLLGLPASAAELQKGSVYIKMDPARARGAVDRAVKQMRELSDEPLLKTVLPKLAADGDAKIDRRVEKNLRAIRKPAKAARSLLVWLDDRHDQAPIKNLAFSKYVTQLGHLNSALSAEADGEVEKSSKKTLAALTSPTFESDLTTFQPTSEPSFQAFLGKRIVEVRATMRQPKMTADEFHDIRKVMRALYFSIHFTSELHDSTPAMKSTEELLGKIGSAMSDIHEKQEQRSLKGKVDYDELRMTMPADIRADIDEVLGAIRLTP